MPAWFDQDDPMSAQPCGCDPGCKPKPYFCALHDPESTAPIWWRSRGPRRHDDPALEQAMTDAFNNCHKGPKQEPEFPQDASAASSVLGDTCPRCGGQLDADGGQFACSCPPAEGSCPRCGTPGDQDDCSECHPIRPR